jgi:hypothetical protein
LSSVTCQSCTRHGSLGPGIVATYQYSSIPQEEATVNNLLIALLIIAVIALVVALLRARARR